MPRVLITDNLSSAGIRFLEQAGLEVDVRSGLTPAQVRDALMSADGIIIRSGTTLTPEILAGQKRCRVIVRAGVGVDNIDLAAATREGIIVMNTPAGNTTSTAEHTIAMLMALSRNIAAAHASMKAGKWDRKSFTGTQIAGKTLGVFGLGRIGMAVARRAIGMEMKVVGYDPFLSPEKAAESGITLFRNPDDVCTKCDYVTVHTPMTEETRGLIDARRIGLMKKGVRIINCARGGIVDESALAAALESGHVAGAALDVYSEEPPPADLAVLKQKSVLTTPHLGASTDEAQELVAMEAAEIISGFLMRGEIRHAVNMAPISASELGDMKPYLDLAHRLGMTLAQLSKGAAVKSAELLYRGEVANRNTRLVTAAFTAGLLDSALDEAVNIVNAELLAKDRGLMVTEATSTEIGDFSTLIRASIETSNGPISATGTVFGKQFLRLVKLGQFSLDAYLDGLLLIYRHTDRPGLIGFIGTVMGRHNVNIAHMALGREKAEQGGNAVAVLNLDDVPPPEALAEVKGHANVTAVEVVRLPPAGSPLPWLMMD